MKKDGSRFWAYVVITALYGADGKLRGYSKVTQDLSERKSIEDELDNHRKRLETLIEERTEELSRTNADLEEKNRELERFNTLFVEREFRIKELRDKINKLEGEKKDGV